MKHIVKQSIDYSIAVQGVTLLANVYGLSIPLEKIHMILHEILVLETGVQGIELLFYIWYRWITHNTQSSQDITKFRYYDWAITTPMMLISTMSFYAYLKALQYNKEPTHLWDLWTNHKSRILLILGLNAIMLVFGYLQEIGWISLAV